MKLFFFLSLLVFVGCADKAETIQDFIPGTYVYEASGKHSIVFDTIVISEFDRTSEIYFLVKNTGYNRIVDGVKQDKELEQVDFKAVFNSSTNQLEDTRKAKVYTFFPDKNAMQVNQAVYVKIR